MRTLEQLKQLAKNPFYKMSDAEMQVLKTAESQEEAAVVETPKKKRSTRQQSAVVKATGKIDKHSTEPVEG